jgi:hypothetical protein
MPRLIDNRIADRLVSTAVASLDSPRGSKVVCTRRALDAALLAAVREAHEIGFLAGQQQRYANAALARPGSPARPAWMDIRLDPWKELARHGIRIRPVVVQSLVAAGYRRLGDLRWIPERQLIGLHYVGVKTARALRAARWSGSRRRSHRPRAPGGPRSPCSPSPTPHRRCDHRPPLFSA